MRDRCPLLFIAWTDRTGRAEEMAEALGGQAVGVYPQAGFGGAPIRYLMSAAQTVGLLVRKRPERVIVTHPPVFAALVTGLWARATGTPFVLDSHPTAFGAKDNRLSKMFLPVHRYLARRAHAVMVASDPWAAVVDSWGGRGLVVHEAPSMEPSAGNSGPDSVLFAGIFASDEPVEAVVAAARELPEVDLRITGAEHRRPAGLGERSPDNVTYTGYLARDAYVAEVESATVLLALSTEPTSVMRAAYEAVYAQKPLVTSDSAVLREAFPDAVHVENSTEAIVTGVRRALAERAQLLNAAPKARQRQMQRWDEQLSRLRQALLVEPTGG